MSGSYLGFMKQVVAAGPVFDEGPNGGDAVESRHRHAGHCCLQFACLAGVYLLVACSATSAQRIPVESPPTVDSAPADGSAPLGTVTAKLVRYAQRIVKRYDTNGDGRLEAAEWKGMHGKPEVADANDDGQITVDEFARYAASYGSGRRIRLSTPREPVAQATSAALATDTAAADTDAQQVIVERRRGLKYFAPLPGGVPGWFVERDADGDAQLTLAEFSPKLRTTEVTEFKSYDVNGDGLLTAAELVREGSKPQKESAAGDHPANPSGS